MASETVHLSENLEEDFNMESNPSAFFPEEDETLPNMIQTIGTKLSPEFVAQIDAGKHYMGNISMLYSKFIVNKGISVFDVLIEQPEDKDPFMLQLEQPLCTEYLKPQTPGLLHLPDYIKARVLDISTFVSFRHAYNLDVLKKPEQIGKALEIITTKPQEKKIVKNNVQTFINNNSFYVYSKDLTKRILIFCPMLSYHDTDSGKYWTFKFLQLDKRQFIGDDIDYTIHPMIYSVYIPCDNIKYMMPIRVQGDIFNILYKTNRGGIDPFPKSFTFYDPVLSTKKTLPLQDSNPVDCATVSMQLCGLLDQPSVMRYHNMFRAVDIVKGKDELDLNLSPGSIDFFNQLVGSKVISFFNRHDPDSPLKKIKNLRIYVHGSQDKIETDRTYSVKAIVNNVKIFYRSIKDLYVVKGYVKGNTLADNIIYFTETLTRLGLARPNVFYSVGIPGHQITIRYDSINGTYVVMDYQVNEEFTNTTIPSILEHPSFGREGYYYEFIGVETSLPPQECNLVTPDLRLLYDWHRDPRQYTGDPFPTIRYYINDFITQYTSTGRVPLYPRVIKKSVGDLLDLDLKTTHLMNELRGELEQEMLGLVQHPNPAIDFGLYPKLFKRLNTTVLSVRSRVESKKTREYIKEFIQKNGGDIISEYNSLRSRFSIFRRYTVVDVYNLLLSRPIFCELMRQLKNSPNAEQRFVSRIATYLYKNYKPTLDIYQLLEIEILSKIGNSLSLQLLRYLASLKDFTLNDLFALAEEIREQIGGENPTLYERLVRDGGDRHKKEMYDAISRVLISRAVALREDSLQKRAKDNIIFQVAAKRVLLPGGKPITASRIKRFFENPDNRVYLDKVRLLVREEYESEPHISSVREVDLDDLPEDSINDVVLDMLQNLSISYEQQPILTREELPRVEMLIEENIRERIGKLDTNKRVLLSKLKKSVESSRIMRRKLKETEEKVEQRQAKEYIIHDLIEEMIFAEQNVLEDISNWSRADLLLLEEAIENQRKVLERIQERVLFINPVMKEDAVDAFFTVITILKNITPALDRNFLGMRSKSDF